MTERGTYGRGRTWGHPWGRRDVVGASILQTPGAIADELSGIDADFRIFSKEITNEIERRGYPIKDGSERDPVVQLFRDAWTPLIQEWQSFYAGHQSTWGNLWWNPAPDAEAFQRKLIAVRAEAAKRGMKLSTPAPETYSSSLLDPHHDVLDTAGNAVKTVATDTEKLVKVALYGALGLGGVVVLASVVHAMRSGQSPAAPYWNYARRLR